LILVENLEFLVKTSKDGPNKEWKEKKEAEEKDLVHKQKDRLQIT
jgi:hypothetical protein